MAIAFDNGAVVATGSNAGSLSGSFTVTGSNPFLIAYAWGAIGSDTVSDIQYNGVSLTKIGGTVCPSDRGVSMWYLKAPATGSNTLSVSGSGLYLLSAASYTGVDQTSPLDSSNTATTTGGNPFTFSTTVVATGCWLVCAGKTNGANPTAGTGTTNRVGNDAGIFDSNGTVGTGSQSLSLSNGTGANLGFIIASFKPAAAAGPANVKSFDGVTQSTGIKTYFGVALASTKTVDGIN